MKNLKERFSGENSISDMGLKMLESLISIFPGDWDFRSKSEKISFFVDNKNRFIPEIEKKETAIEIGKNYPSPFLSEELENELTDEELKEVVRWGSLRRFLRDNMTTTDIANY